MLKMMEWNSQKAGIVQETTILPDRMWYERVVW